MSAVYDNWERLVAATLKKEQFRRLALINSPESSFSSLPSDCSFASSTPDVSVPNRRGQKQHQHLAQATKDMNSMQDSYDRLLSSAAAMANSAFEFSEALGEMGSLIFEETAQNNDENGVKDVLFMLGNSQMQLQELISGYRAHIFQTLANPSESLHNELKKVEEMKNRCDRKRETYTDLMKEQDETGYLMWLQQARDEYDEESTMFSFRTESLKQGKSLSFLTMLSRHHSAQLGLFKKAVRSLEAIDPHVRLLAEQHYIDHQLRGLEDDENEAYNDDDDDEEEDDDVDDDR